MSRLPMRFAVLAALLVSVNVLGLGLIYREVARRPDRVRVLAVLPAGDTDHADRLSFIFDKPLAGAAVLKTALANPPLAIEPAPDGTWMWAAPDRLDFVLARPLPPGRRYEVRPAGDFRAQTGRQLAGRQTFEFSTRRLGLTACTVDSSDQTHANLIFEFNQPVRPADLLDHLRLRALDEKDRLMRGHADFEPVCLTQESAEKIVVRVTRGEAAGVLVELDQDLTGADAELGLGQRASARLRIAPRFGLEQSYVQGPRLHGGPTVVLDFSHSLDLDQPRPVVRVEPAVADLTVHLGWDELRLEGSFAPRQRYTVRLDGTLLARDGAVLGEELTTSVAIPDYEPAVVLSAARGVLSPAGNLLLDAKAVNVSGIEVSAARIHVNNLVSHLRGEAVFVTGRELPARTMALQTARNTPKDLALDLRGLLGDALGIYKVTVKATDRAWTMDRAVVNITDLAITTKRERGGMWVWVTSLSEGAPVAGATVQAISYNNQVLATATTDADGTAHLALDAHHPDGPAWVITAELAGDLAYLRPDQRVWLLDDVDQAGRSVPGEYDVMLYTERGVYRPGDTVYLTGIVRDRLGAMPPTFPLELAIERPDGRVVRTEIITPQPDAGGTFHYAFDSPADGPLGHYRFAVALPGSDEVLGEHHTLIEAFLPARIELTATPTAPLYLDGQAPAIESTAEYLFGRPAAGLPVQITGSYTPQAYVSRRFSDFTFGTAQPVARKDVEADPAQLDDHGKAVVALPPPGDSPHRGVWAGRFAVSVSETGGRSVSCNVTFSVDTAGEHLGLRCARGRFAPIGEPTIVQWAHLNGQDEAAPIGGFDLALQRVEFDWAVETVDGRPVWRSLERLTPVWQERVRPAESASQGEVEITCPRGGRYRLVAKGEGERGDTAIELFAAHNADEAALVSVERPERIELTPEHDRYAPGATAKLEVRSPFAGRLLATLETDRVVWHQVIELKTPAVTLDVPIPADARGSVYLSCAAIRAIDADAQDWLPPRAMGLARIELDHASQHLAVHVDAPAKALPGELVPGKVRVEGLANSNGHAMVHVWAVDEGILLTTGYATPDPWAHFLAPRAAVVETSDAYFDLLPDHVRPVGVEHIGAGEDESMLAMRSGPVEARRTEPAVIWSTMAPLAPDGTFATEMAMPELTGRMRVMAVAVAEEQFGAGSAAITLRRPLVLELGAPRYAAPGDVVELPVKVFNNEEVAHEVHFALDAAGPLELTADGLDSPLALKSGEAAVRWLALSATGLGEARLRVRAQARRPARGEPLVAEQSVALPIRPVRPFEQTQELHEIPAGEPYVLTAASGFVPETVSLSVHVAGRPELELLPAAEALLDYPYGCLEQTTSQLVGLLHAGEVLAQALPGDARLRNVDEMIAAGIARLWSMQTSGGGLAYWAGARSPDVWTTAYAASFLADAQEAGKPVDREFLKSVTAFLRDELARGEQAREDRALAALLCRVLTVLDEAPLGWMTRLSEDVGELDMGGRANLAVAWLAAGRRDKADALLLSDTIAQRAARALDGRITSQVREEAVLLEAIGRIDPQHAWAPLLARRLQSAQRGGVWGNTLENASALAALTRYARGSAEPADFRGVLRVGEREVLAFDHTAVAAWRSPLVAEPMRMESQGRGSIFVAVTTRGLRAGPVEPYDRGLQVSRQWSTPAGEPLDPSALRVGDLVKVTIRCAISPGANEAYIPNVIIVDALPAGMEAENPRLETAARLEDGHGSEVERVEYRDDRVLIFGRVGSQPLSFEYYARVVAAGSFTVPPVQATCMYDAGLSSLNGLGRMTSRR